MVAEIRKTLKFSLFFFAIFHVGRPQTPEEIGQNFCAANPSQPDDNLSCPETLGQGTDCLTTAQFCDGVDDCDLGEDEGAGDVPALSCKSCQK